MLVSLVLLALLSNPTNCRAEMVTVYTNADFAPLVIDKEHGLYHDIVSYLNRLKLDDLQFKLEYLPRKRIQAMLENNKLDGIVIGMMPAWFSDEQETKYLWTPPFARDSFVLVSNDKKPIFFAQSGLLDGIRIGTTLGYVYPGIDEWILKNHMVRDDAPSEEINLEKLQRGRMNAIVVAESVMRYYVKTHKMKIGLIVEGLPGQQIERRFLVPLSKRRVFDKIAPAIKAMKNNPIWKEIQAESN